MVVDLNKYGFKQVRKNKGIKFYHHFLQHGNFIEVSVRPDDVISIYHYLDNENKITVATRYKIENQKELEFLLFRGLVGTFFKRFNPVNLG